MKKLFIAMGISAAALLGGSAANAADNTVKAKAATDVTQSSTDISSRNRYHHYGYRHHYRHYGYRHYRHYGYRHHYRHYGYRHYRPHYSYGYAPRPYYSGGYGGGYGGPYYGGGYGYGRPSVTVGYGGGGYRGW
jgi:hypothetical protein